MKRATSIWGAIPSNFMGHSSLWYKQTILGFLLLNIVLVFTVGKEVAGWILILEFIFTLAMALKCYPLIPGGILALEAVFLGLTSPGHIYHEIAENLPVLLLLMFMVAGIFFLKSLLLVTFTHILLTVRSKVMLSLVFCFSAAVMSAFLDALTVTAVIISVSIGFYGIYHRFASGKQLQDHSHDHSADHDIASQHAEDLEHFRGFLRNLLMHAAVGTALGGVMTLVGEPQNLLIAHKVNWHFIEFIMRMLPITLPVLFMGLLTCFIVERFSLFDYGHQMPEAVRTQLEAYEKAEASKRTFEDKASLAAQAVIALLLVLALMFHLAEVGLIGLTVIVLATTFTGVTDEHHIGEAFTEALPFTALLGVFFAIVAVINEQQLFAPIISHALELDGHTQIVMFYLANGALSAISDNVFVATVYINEVVDAFNLGEISVDQRDLITVAINTGTNIPSVATPNGQAAFLFLLTSSLAPLVRLSYVKMVLLALPYTVVMTLTGLAMCIWVLEPVSEIFYEKGLIQHHEPPPPGAKFTPGGH